MGLCENLKPLAGLCVFKVRLAISVFKHEYFLGIVDHGIEMEMYVSLNYVWSSDHPVTGKCFESS